MPSFILSDERIVNNQGFRIMTAGIDTSQLERNPVMFLVHKEELLPIGKWENIRKEGPLLMADPVYDKEDDDPVVKRAISKAERGFINMASLGAWPPTKISNEQKDKLPGQKLPTVMECTAREGSICPIGANNGALAIRMYDINGNVETNFVKLFDTITNQNPLKKMSKLTQLLKLSDDAHEDVIAEVVKATITLSETQKSEIETLKAENLTLSEKIKATEKAGIIALVDAAIADKKIGADMKDTYVALAEKDLDSTKAILEKMPKVENPANQLIVEGIELTDEQKNWKWADWDKSGKLVELKDKAPIMFEKLFKEQFGTDYKK